MYSHLKRFAGNMDLGSACAALGVSRSSYRDWLARKPLPNQSEVVLRGEIQQIALEFPCYGYRRVTMELHRRDFAVNHKRTLALMRKDNLLCVKKAFRPCTTDSNHSLPVYPNLAKGLVVTGLNQLWVADITYVRLLTEFIYLAAIIDVFSRRCIGWDIGRHIDKQLTLNALGRALACRKGADLSALIHHSDQGVQYAAAEYVERLKARGIRISMSRKGNPYDNAFAESFIKTLKAEEVYIKEYETVQDAYENIGAFIDQVYNEKRLHSSIGYVPPNEFEKEVALRRRCA